MGKTINININDLVNKHNILKTGNLPISYEMGNNKMKIIIHNQAETKRASMTIPVADEIDFY